MPGAMTTRIDHGCASTASRGHQRTSRLVRVRAHQAGNIRSRTIGGQTQTAAAQDGTTAEAAEDGMQIIDEIIGDPDGFQRADDSSR